MIYGKLREVLEEMKNFKFWKKEKGECKAITYRRRMFRGIKKAGELFFMFLKK